MHGIWNDVCVHGAGSRGDGTDAAGHWQGHARQPISALPTVVGLAETLAAMPAVDPSAEFAIPRAPFTPAQKAAGVPCSLRQEDMARRFLVRTSLTSHRLLEGFWSRKITLTFCPSCMAFPLPLQTARRLHHSEFCRG